MAENSHIEWTDHTFNPWIGCSKVSPGCLHCYAETLMDTRYGRVDWGDDGSRLLTSEDTWRNPLRWNGQIWRQCRACGQRWHGDGYCTACGKNECDWVKARVFCASLADIFEHWDEGMLDHKGETDMGPMPLWRLRLFALILATPHLDWLLLTKRPENAARFFREVSVSDVWQAAMDWEYESQPAGKKKTIAGEIARLLRLGETGKFAHFPKPATAWPLPNVWLGTSVEDQTRADQRIPILLDTPAVCRFLSCEPLLGPVNLRLDECTIIGRDYSTPDHDSIAVARDEKIHWVIAGGESGPKARPMHPDWARSLRDQCAAAQVPFLFKQWGEWAPAPEGVDTISDSPWCNSSYGEFHTAQSGFDFIDSCMCSENDGPVLYRVGKKAAGRHLDGALHNAFPELPTERGPEPVEGHPTRPSAPGPRTSC